MTFREIDLLNPWGLNGKRRYTNSKYLGFVAENFKCLICGSPYVQVSHTRAKSAQGSDALVQPLCVEHHLGNTGLHKLNRERFEALHKINLNEAQIMIWTVFLLKHNRDIDVELAGLETRDAVLSRMESLIEELA